MSSGCCRAPGGRPRQAPHSEAELAESLVKYRCRFGIKSVLALEAVSLGEDAEVEDQGVLQEGHRRLEVL